VISIKNSLRKEEKNGLNAQRVEASLSELFCLREEEGFVGLWGRI
jgi:hypothetical protein